MNENILNNEEIIVEAIEEATVGTGKVGKIFGVVAVVGAAGVALYKGGKWLKAKIKARKEQREAQDADYIVVNECDIVTEDDEK